MAAARLTCAAVRDADFWPLAYALRWPPAGGLELRAGVGKMAYILRHTCERLSRDPGLSAARAHAELARGAGADVALDRDVQRSAHDTRDEQLFTLERVREELEVCAGSDASADALVDALERGLCVLSSNGFFHEVERSWAAGGVGAVPCWTQALARKFAVWHRGELTVFHAIKSRYHGRAGAGMAWQLHAHHFGVPDVTLPPDARWEPCAAAGDGAARPHERRAHYVGWFERLLRLDWAREGRRSTDPVLGALVCMPERVAAPRASGADTVVLLQNCCHMELYAPDSRASAVALEQDFRTTLTPARVGRLLDALGLDAAVVGADDCLYALLMVAKLIDLPPAHVCDECHEDHGRIEARCAWTQPPGGIDEMYSDDDGEFSLTLGDGLCLWRSARGGSISPTGNIDWRGGAPARVSFEAFAPAAHPRTRGAAAQQLWCEAKRYVFGRELAAIDTRDKTVCHALLRKGGRADGRVYAAVCGRAVPFAIDDAGAGC
jgi:hypothetical protein